MDFAEWITNEQNQLLRFQRERLTINIKVAESDEVKECCISALAEQSKFAVSQKDVLGSYWAPAEAFGLAMDLRIIQNHFKNYWMKW